MPSNLVFFGTYTNLTLQTGEESQPTGSVGIYVYRQDAETGDLELINSATDIVNPSFLALSKDERFLFAVNETREFDGSASGAVSSFAINHETGDLRFINQAASGGVNPCHLSVSHDGDFLLVANWNSASIAVISIAEDGRLSEFVDRHVDEPTDDRDAHAHFITSSPDGNFVFSTDTGTDRIMVYRLDRKTGNLTPNSPPWGQTHPGGSPRHLAFAPSGNYVFANGEADLSLSVFGYDATLGELDHLQHLSTAPVGTEVEGYSTSQILAHQSGKFVYVANRGLDTIAMFRFDETSGRAETIGFEPTRGKIPRNFMIDPSGRYLYAANQDSNSIERFAIDLETGFLQHEAQVAEVASPVCIVFATT